MTGDRRKRKSAIWGVCFMLSYLYLYEITWVALHGIGIGATSEFYYARHLPTAVEVVLAFLSRVLWVFSFPIAQMVYGLDLSEPYYVSLVYIPFAAALQWFGWGYFCGWMLLRRGHPQPVATEHESTI